MHFILKMSQVYGPFFITSLLLKHIRSATYLFPSKTSTLLHSHSYVFIPPLNGSWALFTHWSLWKSSQLQSCKSYWEPFFQKTDWVVASSSRFTQNLPEPGSILYESRARFTPTLSPLTISILNPTVSWIIQLT